MAVFLCYDPAPLTSCWTHDKRESMIAEFNRCRIKYYIISSPHELEEILKADKDEKSSIVFFPTTEEERKYLFDRYDKFELNKIIFAYHDVDIFESDFSYVMSDFRGDMRLALTHLRQKGCKKIALLGVKETSYHDRMRAETFKRFAYEDNPRIFYTDSKIYPCLTELMHCETRIDAILCINDFFAFSLIGFLNAFYKGWEKKLLVLSFSNTRLSELFSPSLSSIPFNYINGGKEVVTIHKAISKNNDLSYMHIVMKSSLSARETTVNTSPPGIVFSNTKCASENEIINKLVPFKKCMALEKLLGVSDETDLKIIHCLILGMSLSEIGTALYLTRDTIKYRTKKFKEYLKVDSTPTLSGLLATLISKDKLAKMIADNKKNT